MDKHTVIATGTACLADAGVVADFAAEDVACAKGVLAGVAGTEARGRGEGLVLANAELARDDDTKAVGSERGARKSESKEIHLTNRGWKKNVDMSTAMKEWKDRIKQRRQQR